MATSQNSWSANDRSCIASYQLPGGRIALRKGDVSVVLLWVAQRFHETVEPLVWPGNWGYAERPIRGLSTTLSNHASGTALDLNAPAHPLGKAGTFRPGQVQAIRSILGYCEGVVRWGGDYSGRKDEMHFEINAGSAAVRRIADKIRNTAAKPVPRPQPARVPAPRPLIREDDELYIKCQPDPTKPEIWTALLVGPHFISLGTGEARSADGEIARGATCQWVERGTWQELDRRSHALTDTPRPVTVTKP
jgi:hypothetical protein